MESILILGDEASFLPMLLFINRYQFYNYSSHLLFLREKYYIFSFYNMRLILFNDFFDKLELSEFDMSAFASDFSSFILSC